MQVINGKMTSPVTRQSINKNTKPVNSKSSDLIDLTDEEDKTRSKFICNAWKKMTMSLLFYWNILNFFYS